jgi:NAD(P)-dependent dehydrogenase (short-subunit alcohol dehydrogenase family)
MPAARWSLEGRTVLVTGAARGIGAEASRRLAARGARVALVGLEPEELARCAERCGPGAHWCEADVTDRDALERAVAETVQRTGGIDAVVANAGIGAGGTVRSVEVDAWERVIEVNLMGVWRTIRACLPHVIERRGYVLTVASLAALTPQIPGMTAYSAAKSGVEALSRGLANEVSHLGVDVGVAYFSWISTDLVTAAHEIPSFEVLRSRQRGPLARDYPVSVAADAVVRGVESRAHTVVAPGWVRALIALRGLIAPAIDRDMRRAAPDAVRMLEERAEREGAAASAPVGAGGTADVRARETIR